MTCPDLANVVWFKTISTDMNIPVTVTVTGTSGQKKVKYTIPEIPNDSEEKKSGTDWVLPKIIGSGWVSGTRQALILTRSRHVYSFDHF